MFFYICYLFKITIFNKIKLKNKIVNHPGSQIDARPYLPINGEGKLQDDGEERLLDVVVAALKKDVYR